MSWPTKLPAFSCRSCRIPVTLPYLGPHEDDALTKADHSRPFLERTDLCPRVCFLCQCNILYLDRQIHIADQKKAVNLLAPVLYLSWELLRADGFGFEVATSLEDWCTNYNLFLRSTCIFGLSFQSRSVLPFSTPQRVLQLEPFFIWNPLGSRDHDLTVKTLRLTTRTTTITMTTTTTIITITITITITIIITITITMTMTITVTLTTRITIGHDCILTWECAPSSWDGNRDRPQLSFSLLHCIFDLYKPSDIEPCALLVFRAEYYDWKIRQSLINE